MEDCRADVAGAIGDNESYKLVINRCDTWRCEALRSLCKENPSLCASLPLHTDERTLHCRRWSRCPPISATLVAIYTSGHSRQARIPTLRTDRVC
jgi:hypothetical protein